MKVNPSVFLMKTKPVLKLLLEKLLEQYDYASILATDSQAKSYSVSRRNVRISQDGMLTNRGFVVKVSDGGRYGEYSFNHISEEKINEILAGVSRALVASNQVVAHGMCENRYSVPVEEPIVFVGATEYEVDPVEMGDDAILDHLRRVMERGLAVSEQLIDCHVACNYQKYSKIFLSKNKDLEQHVMWMTGMMATLASRGQEIKDYHKGYSNLGGAEVLRKMEEDVEECARVAVELLESESMVPGEYDCICDPGVTGMIVHEAFGHGVEMDMFVKKRALAEEYVGQYVASPLVTMRDGAASACETATYFFDDEGTMAHDTVVIDNGILKQGISDLQSAMILGTEPTGNGRRESYKRKAYTRMTNTFFEGGNSTKEEMIASIQYGFLLENASSGMEDPKNWGIQCMVNIAREIKDGKLTGRIFSPIVLTGYVPDLLKSISMMSETVELGGGGFCGKGYKEWVKVSDGGPYIKARIRLG